MEKITDKTEIQSNQNRYSKLSIIVSLLTMGLFIYLFSSIPTTVKAKEGIPEPPVFLIIMIQFFYLLGIILTGLSFIRKEPSTWYKWIGGILSILLFITIVGSIVWANIL